MDIITIKDKNNNLIKMEIVLTYCLNNVDFIIYSSLDKKDYFLAKYNKNGNLNTNLSDEEIEYGNKILKGVLKNAEG